MGTQLRFFKKESVHKLMITVLANLKNSEFLSFSSDSWKGRF